MNWRNPLIIFFLRLSGNGIPSALREIDRVDQLSISGKRTYQEEKLIKLLRHAFHHVPYYRKVLKMAGVTEGDEVHLERFRAIPTLTKQVIREQRDDMRSDDIQTRGAYKNTSGGSTGESVIFLQDKDYSNWNIANKLYYKKTAARQELGDPELRLWGSDRDILKGKETITARLRNWLYHRRDLNSYRMTNKDMEGFVRKWNEFKPQWVEAYVRSAYELGKFVRQQNQDLHVPRGVLVSAGTLYPEVATFLGQVFRCPIYNRYGSREAGDIACNYNGGEELRLSIWNHYTEILNDRMEPCVPGESGEVYVTTLNNYSMPLIRYAMKDTVVYRDFLAISAVHGRETEIFTKKNGDRVHGGYFNALFYYQAWVQQFKIIQKDYALIECHIVPQGDRNVSEMANIERDMRFVMGDDCRIAWKFVDNIPPLASGKYTYTISEIVKK